MILTVDQVRAPTLCIDGCVAYFSSGVLRNVTGGSLLFLLLVEKPEASSSYKGVLRRVSNLCRLKEVLGGSSGADLVFSLLNH